MKRRDDTISSSAHDHRFQFFSVLDQLYREFQMPSVLSAIAILGIVFSYSVVVKLVSLLILDKPAREHQAELLGRFVAGP